MPGPRIIRSALAAKALERLGWVEHTKTDETCIFKKPEMGNPVIPVAVFQRAPVVNWSTFVETCNQTVGLSYEQVEKAYDEIEADEPPVM